MKIIQVKFNFKYLLLTATIISVGNYSISRSFFIPNILYVERIAYRNLLKTKVYYITEVRVYQYIILKPHDNYFSQTSITIKLKLT